MTKYTLVTGGSRGIGRSICLKLASQGHNIIINYQSNDKAAEETLREVRNHEVKAELLKFDVSDIEDIITALEGWLSTHPDDFISVLVNNAGIRKDNVMVFMPDEDWHKVLDTTLNGFFYITRMLLPLMMRKREGRVVNVASLSGVKGLPGQVNYSAAKAALIGATKALAQEVAPRRVTVNAVAPGFISTDMTKDLVQEELKALVPMRRFGTPDEVASMVAFLVSDEASYITGEVININGGLYT